MKYLLFRLILSLLIVFHINSCCQCLVAPDNTVASKLQQGEFIRIKCLEGLSDAQWLQVRSKDGEVVLTKDSLAVGTKWYVHKKDTSVYIFQSIENISSNTFLDGRTVPGTVGMAPDTLPPYSGTKWRIYDMSKGEVAIKCLGLVDGAHWLDGRTNIATVGLSYYSASPDGNGRGTLWQIQRQVR